MYKDIPAILVSLDFNGNILFASQQFYQWTPQVTQLIRVHISSVLDKDLYLSLKEYIANALSGHDVKCNVIYPQKDNTSYDIKINHTDTGCILIAHRQDYTFKKENTKDIIQRHLNVTLDTIDQGITIYDENLDLILWNRRYEEMKIFPPEQTYYGVNLIENYKYISKLGVFGEGDPDTLAQEHIDTIRTQRMKPYEDLYPPTGRIVQIHRYYLSGGGICATFRDVTEERLNEKKLIFQANHDDLTGAPNRKYFMSYLNDMIHKKKQEKSQRIFYLIFVDLNFFKKINDTYGHHFGDKLLKIFYEILKTHLNIEKDFLARVGGDEFIIIIDDQVSKNDIYTYIQKIQATLRKPIYIDAIEIHLTSSLGVCQYPNDGQNAEELITHADIAMFEAKNNKNHYHFYTKRLGLQASYQTHLGNQLHTAIIQNKELYMQYQPIINLKTGKIHSVEALLRWNNKKFGQISPNIFIPIAEERGYIHKLGAFAMKKSLTFLSKIQKIKPNFKISINVSPKQLIHNHFSREYEDMLRLYQISPKHVSIEITESNLINEIDMVRDNLSAIVALGSELTIDDFETKYASLSYISKHPFTSLKIDIMYIQHIPRNKEYSRLVKMIIEMGKAFNLTIIAEGIENEEQKQFLIEHGCLYGQGFLFHRPMYAKDFITLLEKT